MLEDLKNELSSIKYLAPLLLVAVIIYLVQIFLQFLSTFSDIVLIIVFAWILSFILEPLVLFVHKKLKIPVIASTSLIYILFGLIISVAVYFLIPIISEQVQILAKVLPIYLASAPPFMKNGSALFLNSLGNYIFIIPSVAQFLIYFLTTLILSFYLIIERETITKTIHRITPKAWIPHLNYLEKAVNQTLGSFLRIQLIFGIISGIMTFIVLIIFGISFAPSTSVVAGILTIIPVIGTLLALIPPFLVSFITDPSKGLIILAILLVLQQLSYNILGPKLIGGAFKIHPIIVLLSLLIGLKVAGLVGGIFAVPIVSIVTLVGKDILDSQDKEKK